MRIVRATAAACVAAAMAITYVQAQQQDADRKVAGGGVTVKGWQGKEDAGNKQGLTVTDSKFAPEGSGFRLTTGPAALYWNPANTGKGDYSVKATFTEAKQTYNHPHPFGVFIGGAGLDSATPQALYCAAYRNGNFIVRGFSGGKRFDVVAKPTPNAAVKTAAAGGRSRAGSELEREGRQARVCRQRHRGVERHEGGRHRRRQADVDRWHRRDSRQPQL